jgi:hypothetical protein
MEEGTVSRLTDFSWNISLQMSLALSGLHPFPKLEIDSGKDLRGPSASQISMHTSPSVVDAEDPNQNIDLSPMQVR